MSDAFVLPETCKIVSCLAPAADAAGRTGTWISTKTLNKVFIFVHINQGNAATVLLSLLQAQDVSGTGSKAGPPVNIWANTDAGASDTLVYQGSSSSTYTTDAGTPKVKLVVFEVDPGWLDVAGGFKDVTVSTGASNAANITQAEFVCLTRYKGAGAADLAVITD
jgi:hypothetical protein